MGKGTARQHLLFVEVEEEIKKKPHNVRLFSHFILFVGHKFQQIPDAAVQHGAKSRQHVGVKSCYVIFTIVVELRALHFGLVAQFIFADAGFFDQLVHIFKNLYIIRNRKCNIWMNGFWPVWAL